MQKIQTFRLEITPGFQGGFLLLIVLQLLLQLRFFTLQHIHFVQHFQPASSRSGCSFLRFAQFMQHFQCCLQTRRKPDAVLQLCIISYSLLFFSHVHYSKFAHSVQKCLVLLMIYKECELLHFCNHASASFLLS